ENLSALRLFHFLSVVLLVATYLKPNNPIFRWSGVVLVARTGKCSLEIFSLSAVLSVLLGIIVLVNHSSVLERLILDVVAIMSMALAAVALTEFRKKRQRQIDPVTLPLELIRGYDSRGERRNVGLRKSG